MPKPTRKAQNIPDDFKRIDSSVFDQNIKPRRHKYKLPGKHLQNITSLAEPKQRNPEITDDSHWKIKKTTLDYKPSKRIRKLAKPKWISPKIKSSDVDFRITPSNVNPQALKYKPTTRILELARPKGYEFEYFYKS